MDPNLANRYSGTKIYRTAKTDNQAYLIDIVCPGHGFGVQVDMPEQIALAVSSEWESRLPSALSEMWSAFSPLGGGIGKGLSNALGADPHLKSLSFQMWAGTTPIEIPMTILFDAERSALKEVYEPIVGLQSLTLPVGDGEMLWAPGPDVGIFSNQNAGYGVHVKIGRWMMFLNCIVVSANAVFDARVDNRGYPIAGQIDLVFRTPYVYGRSDWLKATMTGGEI